MEKTPESTLLREVARIGQVGQLKSKIGSMRSVREEAGPMNVPGRQQRRDHAESISLLMSKLMAVRPTRKASNTGGKFSENAWESAAKTWTRQKTI